MSYDKAIKSGHEHRKNYYGAKAIDTTCRNHGSDDYSKSDRLHANNKRKLNAKQKLDDFNRKRDDAI